MIVLKSSKLSSCARHNIDALPWEHQGFLPGSFNLFREITLKREHRESRLRDLWPGSGNQGEGRRECKLMRPSVSSTTDENFTKILKELSQN